MVTSTSTARVRDALLVSGADVLWIRDALRALERHARVNGGGAPTRLRALLELVDEVAGPTAVAMVTASIDVQSDNQASVDVIGTDEASGLLGFTDRYVRQQCKRGAFLSARKRAGRWTLDRSEVLSVLEDRGATAG